MFKSADTIVPRTKEPLPANTQPPHKGFKRPVLIIALLAVLALAATACEDFGRFPAPSPPPEETERRATAAAIRTADRATLEVYEHLLEAAKSQAAKRYLAEFYTVCDNWSAERELLKDGSSMWYVIVDMTASKSWQSRPYWQQAGWFVLQDGRVIPSHRLHANALRIEADLQEGGGVNNFGGNLLSPTQSSSERK